MVPDKDATTKAATGSTRLDGVPARAEQALFVMVPGRFLGKRATWSGEICSGERMSSGNEAAMKMDVHDAHGGFLRGFHLSNHYELGAVNSRNEFDRAHSRVQKGGSM